MRLIQYEARVFGLEVGKVECRAEKGDDQIMAGEFVPQACLRQCVASHQACHLALRIETYDGHVPERTAACLNIQIYRSWTEPVIEAPLIARLQTTSEILCAFFLLGIEGTRYVFVVNRLALPADARKSICRKEGLPRGNTVLPQFSFCLFCDAVQEDECRFNH